MILSLKTHLTHNLTLKVISLLLGYGCWHMLSQGRTVDTWIQVPLCFYNTQENQIINAPETISVNISGKKTDLAMLDLDNVALHVDASTLHQGDNFLLVSRESLFLPACMKVVNYAPVPTPITMHYKA